MKKKTIIICIIVTIFIVISIMFVVKPTEITIVGEWELDEELSVFTNTEIKYMKFKGDGIGSYGESRSNTVAISWIIENTALRITEVDGQNTTTYSYELSPEGNQLRIFNPYGYEYIYKRV